MLSYRNGLKKTFLSSLSVFSSILFISSPISASMISLHPSVDAFQKGICYVTWDKNSFKSSYSGQALEMLRDLGIDHLQINVTRYQDRFNSTRIYATEMTPSDSSITYAIKKSHELGLKVMLKPHLDLKDKEDGTYWRADIGFQSDLKWDSWFREYKEFITHYARIAESNGVELFCIGTELSFTTQKNKKWLDVIKAVKKIYSGKLIYAANWDNYKNIGFWSELDYIGIDAYFPLSYKKDPTLYELKNGWKKWMSEIEDLSFTEKKPVIFTEIGYSSTPDAHMQPWKAPSRGNADVKAQAKCYAAFFETVWNAPWLSGVYWWKCGPSIYGGGKNNRRFTPLNKPAAKIMEVNYKKPRLSSIRLDGVPLRNELDNKNDILQKKNSRRNKASYPMLEDQILKNGLKH